MCNFYDFRMALIDHRHSIHRQHNITNFQSRWFGWRFRFDGWDNNWLRSMYSKTKFTRFTANNNRFVGICNFIKRIRNEVKGLFRIRNYFERMKWRERKHIFDLFSRIKWYHILPHFPPEILRSATHCLAQTLSICFNITSNWLYSNSLLELVCSDFEWFFNFWLHFNIAWFFIELSSLHANCEPTDFSSNKAMRHTK